MITFKGYERDVLIYAFRYTLGRATYSVHTMAQVLIDNWEQLSTHDRALFIREIEECLESKYCGMDMDKSQWERVIAYAELFEKVVAE